MTTDEPISWMALAEGTDVHSSDGEELGKVSKVIADVQKDIFSGIAFRSHLLGHQRFAPADKIGEISKSAVHLNISSTEVEELETYHG